MDLDQSVVLLFWKHHDFLLNLIAIPNEIMIKFPGISPNQLKNGFTCLRNLEFTLLQCSICLPGLSENLNAVRLSNQFSRMSNLLKG